MLKLQRVSHIVLSIGIDDYTAKESIRLYVHLLCSLTVANCCIVTALIAAVLDLLVNIYCGPQRTCLACE